MPVPRPFLFLRNSVSQCLSLSCSFLLPDILWRFGYRLAWTDFSFFLIQYTVIRYEDVVRYLIRLLITIDHTELDQQQRILSVSIQWRYRQHLPHALHLVYLVCKPNVTELHRSIFSCAAAKLKMPLILLCFRAHVVLEVARFCVA